MIIKKIFITKISEQAFKSTNEIVDVVEKCLSLDISSTCSPMLIHTKESVLTSAINTAQINY